MFGGRYLSFFQGGSVKTVCNCESAVNFHQATFCKCKTHLLLNLPISSLILNPLNAELNPICCLLALLGAHHFLHVSRIRVNRLQAVISNVIMSMKLSFQFCPLGCLFKTTNMLQNNINKLLHSYY
jgi:hypothetical protein